AGRVVGDGLHFVVHGDVRRAIRRLRRIGRRRVAVLAVLGHGVLGRDRQLDGHAFVDFRIDDLLREADADAGRVALALLAEVAPRGDELRIDKQADRRRLEDALAAAVVDDLVEVEVAGVGVELLRPDLATGILAGNKGVFQSFNSGVPQV